MGDPVQQNPPIVISHCKVTTVGAKSALGGVTEGGDGGREVAENGLSWEMHQPGKRKW